MSNTYDYTNAPADPSQPQPQAPQPPQAAQFASQVPDDVWASHFQMFSPEEMQSLTGGGSGSGSGMPAELAGLRGQDFMDALKQSNPTFYERVKRVGEGREPFPTGYSQKIPQNQMLIRMLGLAYPGYTAQDFKLRGDVLKDFKTGRSSVQVQGANQAILHAQTALDASEKLGGFNTLPAVLNPLRNAYESQFDTDYQTQKARFEASVNALGGELTKAFRGSAGALEDVRNWKENALAANSPATRAASIRAGMELLHGSLETLADKYNAGMSSSISGMQLLRGKNAEIFSKIMGIPLDNTQTKGYYGDSGPDAGMQDPNPSAPKAPAPGNYIYQPGKGLVPR
jgi:hypothetical protein